MILGYEPEVGEEVWYDNTLNTGQWEKAKVTGYDTKNGRRTFSVTLDGERYHWGYAYSFLPITAPQPDAA